MIINPKSLTVTQLLNAESEQYVVPAYQRRYSWQEKQLWELLDDISLLEGADTHLLGSIVCLASPHTAGINRLELVDGQQRLTTICILVRCISDRFKAGGEIEASQDIDHMLRARALGEQPVLKLVLDSLDAFEFEQHLSGKAIENPDNPNLALAFSVFRKWVNGKELKDLASFVYRLRNQCVVIRLEVSDAKDAFKLFETINNRGLRLSPTDIIKNFILGNAARFGTDSLALAKVKWAELLKCLDGTNIESFFRLFLCARLKRRITRSYVISNFKSVFMCQVTEAGILPERNFYSDIEPLEEEDIDESENGEEKQQAVSEGLSKMGFAEFLNQLVIHARTYGQIILAKTSHPAIDRHLRNLRMIKSLQSYGFLMALRVGGCSDGDYVEVLRLTEAFLLRRHICRKRSNENERLFARLCGVNCKSPIGEVRSAYREFSPNDESFRNDFATFDFTANLIDRARYCLEQFETTNHGQHSEMFVGGTDTVHVEHIIPQKIKTKKAKDEFGDWVVYLGAGAESKHPHFVSRIGNLTLFAGPLNIGASNSPYDRKSAVYEDSAIKLTSVLPSMYPEFRFDQVEERSQSFAEQAINLWPVP